MNDDDLRIVTLLATVDIRSIRALDILKWDGTYLTDEERELVLQATWTHFVAAGDLLALDPDCGGR